MRNLKRRIALIGPHGSGKSTIGQQYSDLGYRHINIGFLARLARRSLFPSDIPLRLMFELRKHQPGTILGKNIVLELVKWIDNNDLVVIDGFPSHPSHLHLITDIDQWQFKYILCPRSIREQRLKNRSQSSSRKWTPGLPSARDLALVDLIKSLKPSNNRLEITRN